MSVRPMVSVCIANYNGMEVLDDCIRSVLKQQGDIAVEILIHDDASSDASVNHIRTHFPQAGLIVSETNVGFCIANNRMVAQAQGQYLLLLNNDAALYPDALQALLTEARRIRQPAILTLPQYDAATGALVDRGCLLDPFFNPVPNLDPHRSDVAMVIGACLWIPKKLWDECEGFPAWFGSIAEDMYLCCRARLAGYAVRALAVSGYSHWQGRSFGGGKLVNARMQTTFRRRCLSERNKTFVMLLCTPGPFLVALLPLHVLLLGTEAAVLCIAKRNLDCLHNIYAPLMIQLWLNCENLFALRSTLQAVWRVSVFDFYRRTSWLPRKLEMLLKQGLPEVR